MSIKFVKRFVPDLSKELEENAYKTTPEYVGHYAATTDNNEHIGKLLNHRLFIARIAAAGNPNISDKNLDAAFNYKDEDDYKSMLMRKTAVRNINAKEHHISAALDDDYIDVRAAAAENPNATKDHLDKALLDQPSVRRGVARNKNIDRENLLKTLNDPDVLVRKFATANPRYKEYFPNGH